MAKGTRRHGSDEMKRVQRILDEIEALIAGGYRQNAAFITDLMSELTVGDRFLEFYFRTVVRNLNIVEMIGAQSFIAHASKSYYARINFWQPKGLRPLAINRRYDKYFSVGVLHNHSFDFFTVGIFGPGYKSIFFSLNVDIRNYEEGDIIPLEEGETLLLSKGLSIFMPKSTAFHVQYEPSEFSLSLNVIPTALDDIGATDRSQLIVDVNDFVVLNKFHPELLDKKP
jgi:hypothetical protein